MPSGSPVSGTRDAKFYGAKGKATPKAGYHEKQKDDASCGAEGESPDMSNDRRLPGIVVVSSQEKRLL